MKDIVDKKIYEEQRLFKTFTENARTLQTVSKKKHFLLARSLQQNQSKANYETWMDKVFCNKNISIDLDYSSKSTRNLSNRNFAPIRNARGAKISMELNKN